MQLRSFEVLLYPTDSPGNPKRISAVTTTYNSMQIPDAVVKVAIGKPMAAGGRQPDNVIPSDWLDQTRLLRIALRSTTISPRTLKAVTTEQVLFEGYPNAPSSQLGPRSGEIAISMQHWLRDLTTGSVLHEYAYPVDQSRKLETLYRKPDDSGSATGYGSLADSIGLPIGWETKIKEDVWANGLKKILSLLATKQVFGQFTGFTACDGQLNAVSPLAASALQRIQGPSGLLGSPYADGGVPLAIRGDVSEAGGVLTTAIASLLGDTTIQTFQGSTFWDHMLRACAELFVEIIPRPLDALLVPMIATPDAIYGTQILEDSSSSLNWAETKQMAVRGIFVLAPSPNLSGVDTGNFTDKELTSVPVGCHVASNDPRYGRIFPVGAPVWLSDLSRGSPGLLDGSSSRQSDPGNGAAPPAVGNPATTGIAGILNDYAKSRYVEEALRYRTAVIMTAFRTDIAVGSTVAVSLRTDAIASTVGSETTTLIGRVASSTHSIDRTASQANSHFSLTHVRSLQEFQSGEFTVSEHPIFSTKFLGAPLIKV